MLLSWQLAVYFPLNHSGLVDLRFLSQPSPASKYFSLLALSLYDSQRACSTACIAKIYLGEDYRSVIFPEINKPVIYTRPL